MSIILETYVTYAELFKFFNDDLQGWIYREDRKVKEEMWISKGRVEFSGITLGSNLFGDWRQIFLYIHRIKVGVY
jgi:hypothetical protein